jgi:hypothetical protein
VRHRYASRFRRVFEVLVAPPVGNLKPSVLIQASNDLLAGHHLEYNILLCPPVKSDGMPARGALVGLPRHCVERCHDRCLVVCTQSYVLVVRVEAELGPRGIPHCDPEPHIAVENQTRVVAARVLLDPLILISAICISSV